VKASIRERAARAPVGVGPWRVKSPWSLAEYWTTEDADPRNVYHDVLIALDESLDLNNGQPSLWAFLLISNIPPDPRVAVIGNKRRPRASALLKGRSPCHDEALRTQVAPKLLAEQRLDVGVVVNHKNQNAQVLPRSPPDKLLFLGRTIVNSVNCPGSVVTSILPPCCFTMMSCVIERPRPVPSPAGLVVKNGLNIFSCTATEMPVPLSRMRISTVLPKLFVVALSIGS